jgi:peptide-methionine (S)-S-oxide reductase
MVFGFGSRNSSNDSLKVGPDEFPDADRDIGPALAVADNVAILGGGCFWCVDGIYRMIDGVTEVHSGYAGGSADTATYEATCRGDTGHAEVVLVRFDPARVSYGKILKIFFAIAHDPTQLNRQGNDVGTQYRSVIFHNDAAQREVAESRRAHRHRGGAAGRLLRGRALSSGLRGPEPGPALYRLFFRAEDPEAA